MKAIKDLVIEKLKESSFEIIDEKSLDENEYMITTKDAIIIENEKDKKVNVSFHISSKIEDSVILALVLNEIKEIDLFVGDTFVFDDKGNYVDGEEAEKVYESQKANIIIEDFMKIQAQKHFLNNATGYKC
jgi:hypothetical protein